jgi:glycyl-tRNA synthetase beta chain
MTDQPKEVIVKDDLLIELGCEELPPKSLEQIRDSFFASVCAGLEKNHIAFEMQDSRSFSSPRRLAILLRNVSSGQPDQEQSRRGPAISAAFDSQGKPTGAALGFAKSVGKEVSELERVATDKGEWLFSRMHTPGQPLCELIYPILETAIRQLPVPRPMRWANNDFSFIRPVHWLVVMHGKQVLEGCLLGKNAANLTHGHRIHSPGPHALAQGSDYLDTLEQAYVLADQDQRQDRIRQSLVQTNPAVNIDNTLLKEVNNLVEWPVVVACSFEEEFLSVPHAALVASMKDHQKFFPVTDGQNPEHVTNQFLAVSNIESSHPETVREGFERVIRPRLADARFFLEQDQKEPLESNLRLLDRVVFQKILGSVGDKSRRIASISKKLAELTQVDKSHAERAARLAKCDLMTQMVGEFPELQGVMGRHYALFSGEDPGVAEAIAEHYAPRFAGDDIPSSALGRIVGIADRLDTLVGIFAAGLRPSGNKDPFALRRAALGLVRILLEARLDLSLNQLLALAANELAGQLAIEPSLLVELREFVIERLRHYYREQGIGAELISAAIASDWDTLPDLDSRLNALAGFMGQESAESLAAANKRIGNILKKSNVSKFEDIDEDMLIIDEEKLLFDEVIQLDKKLAPLLNKGDYEAALKLLSRLRHPVDAFFDAVMVMDEDVGLKNNRLALLARLKSLFDRIADLSVLG